MDYSVRVLVLLVIFSSVSTGQFPKARIIKEWVDQMQKDLISLTDSASGIQNLVEIYHKHEKHFVVKYNNATELVAKAAGEIERLLAERSDALRRLVKRAEKLQMDHKWSLETEGEDIVYYNAKDDLNQTDMKNRYVPDDFRIDPDFKRLVSYNTTAVHIPTDIYEGSSIILNELNWTQGLEETFRKNKEEDPSLLWQVFGSATGLLRYFPASPWIDLGNAATKLTFMMCADDHGEERAEEIFEKYNPKQAVRIFTFSVGQHNYDKGPIQWMACANKGYYYEIPSIGAIRLNTQEYLDVLGRPMVKADRRAKQVQWTNVYLDALKSQNQLILGVMAVDVSLDDIKRLTPRFTFGPNGYYFAIDPNGYVLLHPNLQPLTAKFDEPVTLDFLDAEMENEVKVEMRRNMIDGLKGKYTMTTFVKSQDERYMDIGKRTYTYANVKSTDYSLALVLPEYSKHYIQTTIGDTITQAKFSESLLADKFDEYGYTFIAPREYCKDLKTPDKDTNNTEFLMEFNSYIDTQTPNNPRYLINVWRKSEMPNGVTARFVATDGGITRVYPKSAGFNWKEDAETYESSFYKRSLDNDLYIFTPTPYIDRDNSSDDSILVSRAVDFTQKNITVKPAVVGVKLDINTWMSSFINTTQRLNCNDEICGCQRNDEYVDCVILDDGGFLLMSNRDTYIDQVCIIFTIHNSLWIHTMPTTLKISLSVICGSLKKHYEM
ncbi:hypothetical protein WMY93_025770 [Mugilogobius chulae]|uniref:Uncharacterized protein n=1 Tax=Mugilogobius chulae TaxID=88201 RepID=A0AAW0MX90_9GOBI